MMGMADTTRVAQINWLADYEEALAKARQSNKPVYLDFWFGG
jgi:uncharacterized protein YyaL (SSP411 family)